VLQRLEHGSYSRSRVSSAYLLSRPVTRLTEPWSHQDVVFAADRLDGVTIELGIFGHCAFANISFKGAELRDCHFIDCIFVGCYFRKTLISGCKFDGCRFIDCDFPKTRVQRSSFAFPRFSGCFISFEEMRPNLPSEPGLRVIAANELAREAQAAGETNDARLYRIAALRAHEKHLWAGFRASTSWYKERYDVLARLRSGAAWLASQVNRLVWGNGERGVVLLGNFLLLTFAVFPLVFYLLRDNLSTPRGSLTAADYLLLSIDNMTARSGFSGISLLSTSTRAATAFEVAMGLVAMGLFVTILFRRITRWR